MQQVLAVMYRESMIRRTSPLWFFFELVVPLLYFLMFGVALDSAIGLGFQVEGNWVAYNVYFLAGVLSMACFGSAINQSYGFFVDRENGIFYEFLTYPMTRGQFLLGKILFSCLMSVIQCVLTVGAATLLLGIAIRWEFLLFLFAGMIIGTAGWFFALAIFAFRIRRNDTYNTVINAAYFVLMFLSSMFYPLDNAPGWLKAAAAVNPATWHTDILRYLTIGLGDLPTITIKAIAFGLFLIASFWMAVRTLRRAV